MASRWLALLLTLWLAAPLSGCEASSSEVYPRRDLVGAEPCPEGSFSCPCRSGGLCDGALVCVFGRCGEQLPLEDVAAFDSLDTAPDAGGGADLATADLPLPVDLSVDLAPDLYTRPDRPPLCVPACLEPQSMCVQGTCVCSSGYHDGGNGRCVAAGTCIAGYAIPEGETECLPLEEVCRPEELCRVAAGWAAGDCRFELAPEGSACEDPAAHRCATSGRCVAGACEDVWPPCAPAPRPLVFVHDRGGAPADFDHFAGRLVDDGWDASLIRRLRARDPNAGCNVTNAADLAEIVEELRAQSCASHVDIVAHGMGGLAVRHYLKVLGGLDDVNVFVSLGSPHAGFPALCWDPAPNCVEQEMCTTSPFMVAISATPATPADLWWVSFYSDIDAEVPPDTARLLGAENVEFRGLLHGRGPDGLLGNADLYDDLVRVLSYRCR